MQNWPSNFQLLSFQSSNFQFCHFSLLSINFYQCSPLLELSYFFLLSDQNYTILTFILIIIFIVKRKINKKAIKKKKKKNMSANMSKMANANPKGIDEVWMSWNVWTWMKVEASKCVIPLAASISPIRPHLDIPTLRFAVKLPLFSTLILASSSPPRSRSAPSITNATISLLTIPWSPILTRHHCLGVWQTHEALHLHTHSLWFARCSRCY